MDRFDSRNRNTESNATNALISAPWARFSAWLECVCVVTFDLELGQAIEVSDRVLFIPTQGDLTHVTDQTTDTLQRAQVARSDAGQETGMGVCIHVSSSVWPTKSSVRVIRMLRLRKMKMMRVLRFLGMIKVLKIIRWYLDTEDDEGAKDDKGTKGTENYK